MKRILITGGCGFIGSNAAENFANNAWRVDVLFVTDLVRAYELAFEYRDKVPGQAFNMSGGSLNTLSLIELISSLEDQLKIKIPLSFYDWRPGDQHVFICDTNRFSKVTNWKAAISSTDGVRLLFDWIKSKLCLLEGIFK